ncbi:MULTISPECIES: HAD family hydrolase [unclassified Ruminococcus]|uniref:HAD family hydrolase n=1 Tax=unclassified Ruminococcus TaxID=2608920 RepID=UPI002109FDFE|nr:MULTISPECIES: HAD hydrolase-like protein [unclassified Ruminococcus]MCQ4022576.1 HAD hydrolase-like protein [Ruminococcus sp. zg-924]MCQ4114816.1 HAD hydrolase-like protein [Ruminococcus sp. zg-921]
MSAPSCVFWDYNGTLIDDVGTALESVNDMLRKRGKPIINLEQYRSYIDVPISRFYEHIFDLNEISFDTIAQEFAIGYEKHIGENPVMQGAEELLTHFSKLGSFQAIISGSQQSVIERGAKRYGLFGYFDLISGADDHFVQSKVKRAENIAKSHCKSSDEILVIGDCVQDYEVSKALGAQCILLTAGHQSRYDLQRTGTMVVDSLLDIKDIFT